VPQKRLSMNKLRTVLRLAEQGLSQRQIAASCALGQATVSDYLIRAKAADLCLGAVSGWPDPQLHTALGVARPSARQWWQSVESEFVAIQHELQTHRSVTLQLL